MPRIALMPSAYLPTLGGVQELTRALALALAANRNDVEIWVQRDDGGDEPVVEQLDGLVIRRFPLRLPGAAPDSWLPFVRDGSRSMVGLSRAIRTFRPDLLHVQCFGPNGAYAAGLSKLSGLPLVVTLQGETMMDDTDVYEHSATLRLALRLGLRRAAVVTACSQSTLEDAEHRFGLPNGRGRVIFNGVDTHEGDSGTAGLNGAERYVLALGRVVPKKGFDLLIRAFARIAPLHTDVRLLIGGTGSAETDLLALITEMELADRVRLLGRLSRVDVAAAMAGAEVFVMPSRIEPFGIVMLEAWRASRATIATTRGGPPEYVRDDTDGLLVDPFDTAALADAIGSLLADPDRRARLGSAARERVEDFSWDQIALRYEEVYREATGGRRSAGPKRLKRLSVNASPSRAR